MAGSPWLSCYLSKKLLFPFMFTCTCNTQATNCYYLGLPTFWHWNMMVLSRNVLNLVPSCVETQPAHGLEIAHNFLTNPYVLWQKAQAYFYCSQTHSTGQQMAPLAWECHGLDMSNFCRHIKLSRHRETAIIILPATPQGPSSVKKMFWMKEAAKGVAHVEVYCEDRTEQWVSTAAAKDGSWALHLPLDLGLLNLYLSLAL